MTKQYPQTVRKYISSWFWVDNLGPKFPNLHDPYIGTTVLYDNMVGIIKVWGFLPENPT